jgi:hypothetical protein
MGRRLEAVEDPMGGVAISSAQGFANEAVQLIEEHVEQAHARLLQGSHRRIAMRSMWVRASVAYLIALAAVVCGSSVTQPTPAAAHGGTQSPSANVHATGDLNFANCTADGGCSYEGQIVNDGPDCASNVRGVTHLFDASGKEIEAQRWEILGRVRRGNTSYNGCCFSQAAVNAHRTYRTDVTFEPLPCI